MYWVYLCLFVVTLVIPIFIEGNLSYLEEDTAESLLILLVGTAGLLIYIIKEKSLFHHVKEKLWMQQKNSAITKDLSQSYSYIGEMNRKLEIIKGITKKMPIFFIKYKQQKKAIFWELLDATRLLTNADTVALRIQNSDGEWFSLEDTKLRKVFGAITEEYLENNTKHYFTHDGIHGVASAPLPNGTRLFLLMRRQQPLDLDENTLEILTSLILLTEVACAYEGEYI